MELGKATQMQTAMEFAKRIRFLNERFELNPLGLVPGR
jgi:hypothetical protein